MILICRDCHKQVPFGEDCSCGGRVELAKTQTDELLRRAWEYQRLKTMSECDREEILRLSAVTLGTHAENADESGAANISGELAAPRS